MEQPHCFPNSPAHLKYTKQNCCNIITLQMVTVYTLVLQVLECIMTRYYI